MEKPSGMGIRRAVPAGFVGGCLLLAACFGNSSGGGGGGATFDSGGADGVGFDSTMPEETGTDAPPDSPADTGVAADADAGADSRVTGDSSSADAADSAAESSPPDGGDAGGALVRFANLVAGLGSSVDFCVAPSGGSFSAPYMNAQGVSAGLAYTEVSEYAALPPSTGFKVRVVAAGSSSCATALAPDVTIGPSTPASPTTVTFTGLPGDAGPAPTLTGWSDDSASTSPAGKVRFRAIHAAPGLGVVDFEVGVAPYTAPLQTGVAYGSTFAASTVTTGGATPDAHGYVQPGFGTAQVTLLLAGVETTSFYVANNGSPTGSVTAFLVGTAGSMTAPLGFVDCDELAAPSGHKASCPFNSAAPVTIPVRVFHGAPDQGAVDVCAGLAPSSLPFSANLVAAAGNSSGATFLQMTGDLTSIPANTDFKVGFAPVAQPCATSSFLVLTSSVRYQELAVMLLESNFPPSPTYNAYIAETGYPSSPTAATLYVGSLVWQGPSSQSVDVYTTEGTMPETQLVSALGANSSAGGYPETPDTYAFRVADHTAMTSLYDKGGFPLSAGETYFLWWLNQGSSTTGTLAQCPLSQRTSDSLVTCAN
jgi:hypothetical protein